MRQERLPLPVVSVLLKVDIVDKEGCIPEVFSKDLLVRVQGIDTPELRSQCRLEKCLALKAKAFTETQLSEAEILFENEERDKYFRLLANICCVITPVFPCFCLIHLLFGL